MKVQVLYILNGGMMGLGKDEESTEVSEGLFLKYHNRCKAAGVILWNSKLTLDKQLLKGYLPLNADVEGHDKVNGRAADALLDELPASPSGENRSIGVYVVMHGGEEYAIEPDVLAQLLHDMLPAKARAKLHYVVLLACNIAMEAPGEVALDTNEAKYVTQFMRQMLKREMKPVIAGWDVFITAAPHRPVEGNTPRNVYDHQNGKKIENLKSIPGKKIVKDSGQYKTVGNEYRKLHKRLFQITSSGKLEVKLGTWSTRLG